MPWPGIWPLVDRSASCSPGLCLAFSPSQAKAMLLLVTILPILLADLGSGHPQASLLLPVVSLSSLEAKLKATS